MVDDLFFNWTNLIMVVLSIVLSFKWFAGWWNKFTPAEKQRNIVLIAAVVVIGEQLVNCLIPSSYSGVCAITSWGSFLITLAQIVSASIVANGTHISKKYWLG